MKIKQVPAHTNNYGVGRAGKTVNKIVVHWIVGNLASADATFKNPERKATAHYGIEDNTVHQYVSEHDTAWHASNLTVNRESIGIEHSGGELLSNSTRRKPSDQTHQTSGKLIGSICRHHNIPIDRDHVLPHNKFASTMCPGTLDIDKIIEIAKGGDSMNCDEIRRERDNNWNIANKIAQAVDADLDSNDKQGSSDTVVRKINELKGRAEGYDKIKKQYKAQEKLHSEEIKEISSQHRRMLEQKDADIAELNTIISVMQEREKHYKGSVEALEKKLEDCQKKNRELKQENPCPSLLDLLFQLLRR